jgi:tRNA (uracil-5-)-methyltransferase
MGFLQCEYINKCASCVLGKHSYDEQLQIKTKKPLEYFTNILKDTSANIEKKLFKSDINHFRLRAKFRIYHYKENINSNKSGDISYAMNDYNKKILPIKKCSIVSKPIHILMSEIINLLNADNILKQKLFEINFISDDNGVLITLLYHKILGDEYKNKALNLSKVLNKLNLGDIRIIGRYAKNKIISKSDKVFLSLKLSQKSREKINYIYSDDSFIQPNKKINEQMLFWIRQKVSNISQVKTKTLIELYCGAGNFSLGLSDIFKQTLSSEISKKFISLAQNNAINNNILNVEFLRMSAKDFSDAKNKIREFRRCSHINLDNYPLDCMLVDPPRAGLDDVSLNFVKKADSIIYISCNFETMRFNLQTLLKTHKLIDYALFDQFAYTEHLEVGVMLQKI